MTATIAAPATRQPQRTLTQKTIWLAVAAAWAICVLAEATGAGMLLHHHALIENGPPVMLAIAAFSVAWLVMVAGMMLPASLPAISAYRDSVGPPSTLPVARFVGAYFMVWVAFGLFCFLGDMVIYRVVDATPLLLERPWLVEAGLVAAVGAYQFTPFKKRALADCRHPLVRGMAEGGGVGAGFAHALDCLRASGPLMLLMFGAGFANLWWMLAMTAVMAYEARGRHGERLARIAGIALVYLAVFAVTNQGLPAWLPGA